MAIIDDLKVWYDLSADANDDHTVGPYNLTSVGTPTFPADYALLNGSVDYFHVASNADLQTGDIDFSVAGWVYLDSVGVFSVMISKWGATQNTNQEYRLGYNNGLTAFQLVVRDGSSNTATIEATSFGAASVNTWYFVAAGHSASGNVVWISVNAGTVNTFGHSTGALAGGTFRLEVGNSSEAIGTPMNGRLQSWGYWKRDIRSDLSAIYNGGTRLVYADISGGGSPTMTPAQAATVLTGYGMSLGFTILMPDEL